MNKIFLRQLAVSALIGVYEHEKKTPQTIFLDIEASADIEKAAATDQLSSATDYAAIYHYLREYIPKTHFQLLETLVVEISKNLIEKFSLNWVRITITKKPIDLLEVSGVGVVFERYAHYLSKCDKISGCTSEHPV